MTLATTMGLETPKTDPPGVAIALGTRGPPGPHYFLDFFFRFRAPLGVPLGDALAVGSFASRLDRALPLLLAAGGASGLDSTLAALLDAHSGTSAAALTEASDRSAGRALDAALTETSDRSGVGRADALGMSVAMTL